MRLLLLRLLPYLISLCAGLILYLCTVHYIEDTNLNTLIMSVAAGLFSVPFMFICYELIKTGSEKKLHQTLHDHLVYDVNHQLAFVLRMMRLMLGFGDITPENLDTYVKIHRSSVLKNLHPDETFALNFVQCRDALHMILHSKHSDVFSAEEMHALLHLVRQCNIVSAALKGSFEGKNKEVLIDSVTDLLVSIGRWNDLQPDDLLDQAGFLLVNS